MDIIKKKRTTVYLDSSLLESLKANKINVSEYVNDILKDRLLSIQSLLDERKKHEQKLFDVDKKIQFVQFKIAEKAHSLSNEQRLFLLTVKDLIDKGKDKISLWKRFQTELKGTGDLSEFTILVDYLGEEK